MASFKELKNKLTKGKEENQPQPKTIDENTQFELEEARYMLSLIAKSEFKGSDIQVVYNVALKLQTLIKESTQ